MSHFSHMLTDLIEKNLYRELRTIDGAQNAVITFQGQEYLNFSSNNYLGLANHPKLVAASLEATQKHGTGSGASRLVTGSMRVHEELERKMAEFKGTQACLLFNSGYQCNTTVIPALTKTDDVIFSDELNHASLIDGIRLSEARRVIYPHGDLNRLSEVLKKESTQRQPKTQFWLVTDTVFSMDGDLCPLAELLELAAKFDAKLYLDDAHGTGIFGETGSGLAEAVGIPKGDERVIQMATFSKALGSFGAALCANQEIVSYLINRARGFIYSTSLPPGVAAANLAAVELVKGMTAERKRLWHNVHLLKTVIQAIFEDQDDFRLTNSLSPILPIIFGKESTALSYAQHFFAGGLWAQAIRPPSVPAGTSRIRLTVTSSHTSAHIYKLLACLESLELQMKT